VKADLRSQHLNSEDIERLASYVFGTHINDAFKTEAGTDGGCRNTMLACARLCDDALLSKPFC